MEDVSMAQAVPVGIYDNGQVPDLDPKDSPLLRVPLFTQQGELLPEVQLTSAHFPQERSMEQIHLLNQNQNQLQPQQRLPQQHHHQMQQGHHHQQTMSPQLPASPQYPHMVPRDYSQTLNQQVPLSPQHPQINFGTHQQPSSSLHRNMIHQQLRQHLAPPNILNAQPTQQQTVQQTQQQWHQQQQEHQQRIQQQQQQHPHPHILIGESTVRQDSMMAYLMDSLNQGLSIGHYGHLVFAMVAHHFMSDIGVVTYLMKDPTVSEARARALYEQVQARDYNPPRREKILEWQTHQSFPLIPNPADTNFGNVYKDLTFPDHVYQHIAEYYNK